MGHESSETTEISASIVGSGEWAAVGFSVTKSWTSGEYEEYDCENVDNGEAEEICAFVAVGHTEVRQFHL